MNKKYLYLILVVLIYQTGFSQRAQRIAYIDMNFILDHIPEYQQAQEQLNTKIKAWQRRLDREHDDLEAVKKDFSNEKALLTDELIQEREDDIYFKEQEYKQLQEAYFGPKGDLYLYRKLLVQPVQDKVYNVIQTIAVKKRYDFVLDKSSDLIMLYTNKAYDISDLVVNNIVRQQKQEEIKARQDRLKKRKNKTISVRQALTKRTNKRDNLNTVTKQTKDNSEALVDAVDQPLDSISNDSISKTTKAADDTKVLKDTPSDAVLKRIEARNAKRKILLEKIRLMNEAKAKQKEDARKAAEAKRAARLKQIQKYKDALQKKQDSLENAKKNN